MNDPRGSIWRKWDLHVHTPESLVHNYSGSDPWGRFLDELEALPQEFKVLGINDYIFLDGYKRVLYERRKNNRLQNIDLVLPVIELRLDKFGGSKTHLSKVNFHVIFSDELEPEVIEQQFLSALSSKYHLTPQVRSGASWSGVPTRQSLTDLGTAIVNSVPDDEKSKFHSPLIEGFNNLCLSLNDIEEALDSPYFNNKCLTAVGKTEWADVNWNDHSIAEKKTIINGADFVFISAETVEGWSKARESLTTQCVNNRLLDCSDAHAFSDSSYKDRIGKCFTWLKADPTFDGLRQVVNEPDERVFVGDTPPKLDLVSTNSTKYISSVRLERKPGARITETWFDNTLPTNYDLVAIIGNKGKGKRALTDTIGLLANTKQSADFTFLSSDSFRQPKDNKAKYFQATITWKSGDTMTKGLDSMVDERQPELVKYIPQNFLEKICTQLGGIEESQFDRELKKVIFSHVEAPARLRKSSLDELIAYRTSEANNSLQILRRELQKINEEIVALENQSLPEHRAKLVNLLTVKQQELDAHEKFRPTRVTEPANDPAKQVQMSKLSAAIGAAQKQLTQHETDIQAAATEQAQQVQLIAVVDRLTDRLANFERQIDTFRLDSEVDLSQIGLALGDILQISIDKRPLENKRGQYESRRKETQDLQRPDKIGSPAAKRIEVQNQINGLQAQLDEPNKRYQAYLTALADWEKQKQKILGDASEVGTIKFYQKQLKDLSSLPAQLRDARLRRLAKAKEVHAVIRQLAETYRSLYASVNRFIETRPLAREKFHLNFEVGVVDVGFEQQFFEFISHGVSGTFAGVEDGHKKLQEILSRQDFNTEAGIQTFLSEIIDSVENDKRSGGGPVRIASQLKIRKTVLELYDFIYGMNYLTPRYALRLGDKELNQLSPGERGTLLLVFYLLVDKDNIPLVIDQPEENLDNQTVYDLLVPCIKEAKKRRQIFIVTHNPNLAVVCDAEQVICADLDKKNDYKMNYISGAIENPIINKAIVDILEGTMPAFHNRDSKYFKEGQTFS
jgi:predicted Zn-dependent protease